MKDRAERANKAGILRGTEYRRLLNSTDEEIEAFFNEPLKRVWNKDNKDFERPTYFAAITPIHIEWVDQKVWEYGKEAQRIKEAYQHPSIRFMKPKKKHEPLFHDADNYKVYGTYDNNIDTGLITIQI